MELKFIFFTLLIAGSNGSITISRMEKISTCVQIKCASFVKTTTTTTPDPCAKCRNAPVIFKTNSYVMQDVPVGEGEDCLCHHPDAECDEGEIFDTSTCKSSIYDCVCIKDPDDPCADCRNAPIFITSTWAVQDVPDGEGAACNCQPFRLDCPSGSLIDELFCQSDGSIYDCGCVFTE